MDTNFPYHQENLIQLDLSSVVTLMSQIVEHTEIDEHLEEIAENLIVEHLFYTILQQIIEHLGFFSTALINKRVWLLGTPELMFIGVILPNTFLQSTYAWWRDQMETFSVLLAICAGNSLVTVEFPAQTWQRPVTQSFDVFFDLCLNDGWVNNREAGDLRRHRSQYYVTVMG